MAGNNGIVKEAVRVPDDWYRSEYERIFRKKKTNKKQEKEDDSRPSAETKRGEHDDKPLED